MKDLVFIMYEQYTALFSSLGNNSDHTDALNRDMLVLHSECGKSVVRFTVSLFATNVSSGLKRVVPGSI